MEGTKMAVKGLAVFTHQGEDYTINDPNNANEFSSSTAYAAGDYCYYQGTLYRFTSAHAAGVWNGSHATAVKVMEEISDAKNDYNGKISELKTEIEELNNQVENDILLSFEKAEKQDYGSFANFGENTSSVSGTGKNGNTITVFSGYSGGGLYVGPLFPSNRTAMLKNKLIHVHAEYAVTGGLVGTFSPYINASDNDDYDVIASVFDGTNLDAIVKVGNETQSYFLFAVKTSNLIALESNATITMSKYHVSELYPVDEAIPGAIKAKEETARLMKEALFLGDSMKSTDITSSTTFAENCSNVPGASASGKTVTIQSGNDANSLYIGFKATTTTPFKNQLLRIHAEYQLSDGIADKTSIYIENNSNSFSLVAYEWNGSSLDMLVRTDGTNMTYFVFAIRVSNDQAFSESKTITLGDYTVYQVPSMQAAIIGRYYKKEMFNVGHSMTHLQAWQGTVVSDLVLNGYAVSAVYGGTLISNYEDIQDIPADTDIVTLWYDTNDWYNNVNLGTIADSASSPTTSFYAALKYCCKWVAENRPETKLLLISSPKRFDDDSESRGEAYGYNDIGYPYNSNHKTLEDFANAVKDVADLYSYGYLDLFHKSGINSGNWETYLYDGLHPNAKAGAEIGHMVADMFRTM